MTPSSSDAHADGDGIPQISPEELKSWLERGTDIAIVDVREPHEWNIVNLGKLGSKLVPLNELPERTGEFDIAQNIVLHCRSGVRSAKALRILQDAGFKKIWNLDGGILAWVEKVDPTLPVY